MVIPKMARPRYDDAHARLSRKPRRHSRNRGAPTAAAAERNSHGDSLLCRQRGFVCAAALEGAQPLRRGGGSRGRHRLGTSGRRRGHRQRSAPAAAGTWSRRTAYLVGSNVPREILVYSGSEDVKNYRIEFAWVPDPRGVGLIFRASDSANYYAARLRLLQAGATPTLSAEHFAVVKGVEGAHSRKVITLGRTKSEVLVSMDATGPAFTLYLQGSPADYWTDERFETGSLGFYEERGERPVLQALRFTFFKKSGLQTVVTSLQ